MGPITVSLFFRIVVICSAIDPAEREETKEAEQVSVPI